MAKSLRYGNRKKELIALVKSLSHHLDRPVCTRDIRLHLKKEGITDYPYIQSLGQILIKAAVPYPPAASLFQIGIFQYHAYYAADPEPYWHHAFARFRARQQADYLLREGYLTLNTGSESELAQAATFVLHKILTEIVPHLPSSPNTESIHSWLHSHPHPSRGQFTFSPIDRSQARHLLIEELARRAPYLSGGNLNRHLARLAPTVLRTSQPPRYCKQLVEAYASTNWPLREENPEVQMMLFRYWILILL